MKVEIITIGDEILIGQVVDTNSAYMATELNKTGADIVRITTVGDNRSDMLQAIDAAFERADIVLLTGGIGPTKDDITKQVLCEYFNSRLVFDEAVIENIRAIFANRSLQLNELTENQAWVPDNCQVIMNKVGTAPCCWFEKEGRILVSMPGVPSEMKWLMVNELLPRIERIIHGGWSILHHTCLVKNYSESALAEKLAGFENSLPADFKLAYLPQPGIVRLRLTAKSDDASGIERESSRLVSELHSILGNDIFSDEDLPLASVIGKLLLEKNLTMATAESCTGGTIASMITAVPGSSAYFNGGVVSYSNEVKVAVLHVSNEDLQLHGAVSEPVVRSMAEGAARVCMADCSVATSGIAGPGGGSTEKPVGTVWIAAKYKEKLKSRLFTFGKNREYNISRAANAALLMLVELLKEEG